MNSVIQYALVCALLIAGFILGWNYLYPIVPENTFEQNHLQTIKRLNKDLYISGDTNNEHIYWYLIKEHQHLTKFYMRERNELQADKMRKLTRFYWNEWQKAMVKAQGKARKLNE